MLVTFANFKQVKNINYYANFKQVVILLTLNKYCIIVVITYCLLL